MSRDRPVDRPWLSHLGGLLALVVALKLSLFVLSLAAIRRGGPEPDGGRFATATPLFAWDSKHYLDILARGYPKGEPGRPPFDICFFPLYPMMSRPLAAVVSGPTALLVTANLTSLVGFALFYAWAGRLIGPKGAFWAGVLLATYPPSLFLSAAYTEGPFMMLTAATLLLASRGRHWAAALAAGLACGLRPTGVAVSAFAIVDASLALRGTPWSARLPRLAGIAALSCGGLIAYAGYLQAAYGTPMVYLQAQAQYGAGPPAAADPATPPAGPVAPKGVVVGASGGTAGKVLAKLRSPGVWNKALAYAAALLSLVALLRPGPLGRHHLLIPILIFLLGYLPGNGVRLNSIARFETAALPLFVLGAAWLGGRKRPWVVAAVAALWMAIQGLYAWDFSRGLWAG